MAEETDPETGNGRKWYVYAAAGVMILLVLGAGAFLPGFAGSSCNCGPFPRIAAVTEGDAIVVTYSGVYSDREGAWFARRLPDDERLLTGLRYLVVTPDGKEIWQNRSAPGPGLDQSVRLGHAATAGKNHVIVIAGYTDGSSMVAYDRYL